MSISTNLVNAFGAGSGVDTKSLAQSLVDAEKVPREALIQSKIDKTEAKISGYGVVRAILDNVRGAFLGLNDATDLSAPQVSTGGATALSAAADATATPGAYNIDVLSLAKAQRTVSDAGFTSGSQVLNGGVGFNLHLAIDGGEPQTISVSDSNATVGSLVGVINAAKLGVTAQLLNTGDGSGQPYKIVLTGPTGATNSFVLTSELSAGTATGKQQSLSFSAATSSGTIQVSGVDVEVEAGDTAADVATKVFQALTETDGFIDSVDGRSLVDNGDGTLTFQRAPAEGDAPSPKFVASATGVSMSALTISAFQPDGVESLSFGTEIQAAVDAQVRVDGIVVNRASNEISDLIPGVTLNLAAETLNSVVLTVSRDQAELKQKFETLVTGYNDAMSDLDILSGPKNDEDETDVLSGSLQNDSTIRSLKSVLRGMFTASSSTPGESIATLSDLGISLSRTGVMEIDQDKLTAALTNDFSEVVKALTADTNNQSELGTANRGLAGDAAKKIADLLKSDGLVSSQTSSAESQLRRFELDLEKLQERMDNLLKRYTQQFAVMDSIVGQTTATRQSLTGTFDAMLAAYKN